MWDRDRACDDGDMDHTKSDDGEGTNGPRGVNGVIMGDGETNGSLGDGVRDHDGAYNDGKVDHTGSGGGEQTNGAGGVNIVVVDDRETNGSLGDIVWDHDRYQQSIRVRIGIEAGCGICEAV